MSNPNVLASEKLGIVGRVNPATITTITYTEVIDMSKYHQVLGIALLGNMANEEITFSVHPCDAAGANVQAAIKSVVRTAHATNNDNIQIAIGLRREDLLPQQTYNQYVRFGLIGGSSNGGPAAVVVLAVDPLYGPASDYNLNSVVAIKN